MSRVAGADESYMLAEEYFGLSAPIQYLWIYPSDPGTDAVLHLRDQLASGSLNRRVHRVRIPVARHRWVRADMVPDLYVEPLPVPDNGVSIWADDRLRTSDLEPITGNGWRLECAHTVSGRFVLSLLVSHMIADGQGLYNALAAAHAGASSSGIPTSSEVTGFRGLTSDLRDARSQVVEAIRASRIIAAELWSQRREQGGKATKRNKNADPSRAASFTQSDAAPDTLAILDLDRHEWTAAAAQFGGTSNGLLIAVIGGIVQRAGCPLTDEGMRICIAVNKREDGEESANASGGVWIRVPDRITPERGLGEIRRLSKQALIDYSTAGNEKISDNLQTVVRLLPKQLLGKMMRSVVGPEATVSNLGVAPPTSTELGDCSAESFAVRAIMQGHSADDRRRQGPAIAAWAVEYGDKVTVTVFGIHPDYFDDPRRLRAQLCEELAAWGLSAKFW